MDIYDLEQRSTIHEDEDQIKALLHELKQKSECAAAQYLIQGELVERIIQGEAFLDVSNTQTIFENWYDSDGVPRIDTPLLGNIALTFQTLLTRDRPSAYATPVGSGLKAQAAADLGTKLIEYQEEELDWSHQLHTLVGRGTQHGTAGFKIYFDPILDKVRLKIVTIFDYWIDIKPDYKDSNWIIFQEKIDLWDAKEMFASAGIRSEPYVKRYATPQQGEAEGVEKYEIWYRPCYRYPTGLYACIVSGEVVEAIPYPYVFPNKDGKPESYLPVALFHCRNLRDTCYGKTFLQDCLRLQKTVDEINSRLLKILRQTSSIWKVVPKALSEGIDEESGMIYFENAQAEASAAIRYVDPPNVSPVLFQEREALIQAIYNVAGVSDSTVGATNNQSRASGTAVAYSAELDQLKNADSVKSLESMILRFWTICFKLMQKYYVEGRLVALSDGDQPLAVSFRGADIEGLDVRLESRSARSSRYDERKQAAAGQLQAGQLDAAGYNKAMGGDLNYRAQKTLADRIIMDFLSGKDVHLEKDTLDPAIFLQAVDDHSARALLISDLETANHLHSLKSGYLEMLAAPAPGLPPGPAPAPAGPEAAPKPPEAEPFKNTQPIAGARSVFEEKKILKGKVQK